MFSCKKIALIVLSLFFLSIHYTAKSQTNQKRDLLLTGKVTYIQAPLSNVSITIQNTKEGTKTDDDGNYAIKVHRNDVLQFSHIGYITIDVKVGSKQVINIEMIPEAYVLKEAFIKSKKRKNENLIEAQKSFSTSKENVDPRSAGYRISYLKGNDLSNYNSITSALLARVPSYSIKENSRGEPIGHIRNLPVLWDIDGRVTDVEPFLIMTEVKDIRILGPAAAVNYGVRCEGVGGVGSLAGCGAVIVIRMKKGVDYEVSFREKQRISKILNNVKGGEYNSSYQKHINNYSETIRNINDLDKAHSYCSKILNRKKVHYFNDISLMFDFFNFYKDKTLFTNLQNQYIEKYQTNNMALRSLAYELETLDFKNEYLTTFKKIYKIDTENSKSHRNLANAFIDNLEYEKAWRIYASYVRRNKDFSSKHIDKLIFNEMEWLYHNDKIDVKNTSLKFTPKHSLKEDFNKDIRVVIEWDNPEISFNLNFNNKSEESFLFKYNHEKSEDEEESLIEEFYIPDLKNNQWNIDLTYYSNKEKKPTYFKTTCYYNWGRENQYKKTKTFLVEGEYSKRKVFQLSQNALLN